MLLTSLFAMSRKRTYSVRSSAVVILGFVALAARSAPRALLIPEEALGALQRRVCGGARFARAGSWDASSFTQWRSNSGSAAESHHPLGWFVFMNVVRGVRRRRGGCRTPAVRCSVRLSAARRCAWADDVGPPAVVDGAAVESPGGTQCK